MSNFTKNELEKVYNTKFTDLDIATINKLMLYDTIDELKTETKYFDSLQDYAEYAYLSDFPSAKAFINDAIRAVKYNEDIRIVDLFLGDSDDIELLNGRYILVLD